MQRARRRLARESRRLTAYTRRRQRHARTSGPTRAALPRYLRYTHQGHFSAGLNHWQKNLAWLAREAFASDRIALLPRLVLTWGHNFGIRRDWRWDSYFDLAAASIVDPATGTRHPLPVCADIDDAGLRVVTVPFRAPIPPCDADIVIRNVGSVYRRYLPNFIARGGAIGPRPLEVCIPYAPRVLELAAPVVEELAGRGRFAAVRVRRGDLLVPALEQALSPAGIRRRLGELGIQDGAVVFFLSDEHDPAFWAELGHHYETVRYTDFPHLVALIDRGGPTPPDNYLLFAVEQQVAASAPTRIDTFPRRTRRESPAPAAGLSASSTLLGRGDLAAALRFRHARAAARHMARDLARARA